MYWCLILVIFALWYELEQLRKRIDNLASKVYDLEENTVKKPKDYDI